MQGSVVDACAQLADQLLHACANIKIVASSREALGIGGETVYRVPSLSLPNPDEVTREALTQSKSAQLFIERAMAANPKFNVSDKNASFVAQICRRLDGIPLALELAAAHVRSFPWNKLHPASMIVFDCLLEEAVLLCHGSRLSAH